MAAQAASERVTALLATANESISAGSYAKASETLREASHIEPRNPQVQDAWKLLQSKSVTRDAVESIRNYIGSRQEEIGQRAIQDLKESQLGPHESLEAVGLLLHSDPGLPLSDQLTSTLLVAHKEARKVLVDRLVSNPTDVYNEVYGKGDATFNAFASLPSDETLWPSKKHQVEAQKDVFRLNIATLIAAGVEAPDRAMKAVARQVALAPENVADLLDEDTFDVLLSSLDIRQEQNLRSQSMLAIAKVFETTGDEGAEIFSQYIGTRVAKGTNDELIMAFSAASAVFPMVPAVVSKLFMTDGFVQQLVPNLEKNSEAAAAGKRKSNTLEQAALELLSAACINKSCREAIERYCSPWLKALAEDRAGTHKALASLVLAKVSSDSSDSDIADKLSALVLNEPDASDQAIEGLAYTSLQPKVKEGIASNTKLVQRLVTALQERPSVAFGCLTTFGNLTTYRLVQSQEQQKMADLKAYANSSKPAERDPLDDDDKVTVRCKKLLDANVVPALVSCCKNNPSPAIVALIVRIMLSLSKEQKHRAQMAQQGAVKLLLQIRERIAKTDKSTPDASSIEHSASHALARLLISINPAHTFSTALPATSAVSALIQLLDLDQASEERNLLPTFEALLALTNLASMEDETPRNLLLRAAWPTLENQLLLSSNALVQRASVELVCNLMASPAGVAKFADGSKQASGRMHILLALADVEDFATRRAAGGALAMLTEWDAAVSAVLEKERGVRIVLGMCKDESEEIMHRGFVIVMNIISAPGGVGEKGLEKVKAEGGAEAVKEGLMKAKNAEVLGVGVQVLKKLV
ncbi:hypothetical protein MBLNU13_g10117t1 [Cladosporium sp. NU13]